MINSIDHNESYRTAIQLREGEMNRLFQRVSFFLVGTAFLIAALVALITSKSFADSIPLKVFAYLLTSVGFGLSVLFTVSNYINDRIIRIIWELIKDIEAGNLPSPSVIIWFNKKIEKDGQLPPKFILKLFHDLCNALGHPFPDGKTSEHISVPHTWLIPLGFVLFWIGAIIISSFVIGGAAPAVTGCVLGNGLYYTVLFYL